MRRLRGLASSPVTLGLTLTALFLLGFAVWETMLGRWPALAEAGRSGAFARQPGGILRDFRITIVHCLLAGYIPAALLAVLQGGRRTVFALQDALDCTAEECAALAGSIRFSPRALAIVVLIGLGVGFGTPYLVRPVPEDLWIPATWNAEVTWHRVLGPLAAMGSVILAYAIVSVSRRMSRLALELESIDLFDLKPLFPFTQQGLTNALLLIGLLSIYGLLLVTETGFGLLALLIGLGILTGAGLALFLPLRGVRKRIRQAKAGELEWADAELGRLRSVLKSDDSRSSAGALADLAAYHRQVEGVPEWPISASNYVRFALYLLIPVGSWALAAVVERFVDVLLS